MISGSFSINSFSSNSSSGSQEWSNKLTWYPNSQYYNPNHGYAFGETEKKQFFKNCSYDLSKEKVSSMIFNKTPLGDGYIQGINIEGLPVFQVTYNGFEYKLCHVYVIARCDEMSVCFAKTCAGIEVICAPPSDENSLNEIQHQLDASSKWTRMVAKSNPYDKTTIKQIIEWIFDSGEITKGYNSFTNNCKDFACHLFNSFSHNKVEPCYTPDFLNLLSKDSWF